MACLCVIYTDDTQVDENRQYIFFEECFGVDGHRPLVNPANVRSYSFRKLLPLKRQNLERQFCAKK
jgi:hypothetical protein